MVKKKQPPVQQTAIGDGIVQVAGDNNTVNVNQTFIQKVSNFFTGDNEQQRAMRNRSAMLNLVKNTWIKGVLEKSLYNEVVIELGMEERPSAVDYPWDTQVQMRHKENRTLPPNTSIIDVFDEMSGAMLVLGEPGSGKTTMLLELVKDLLTRAEEDLTQPIPVVFNLSSWSPKQPSFAAWLVNELKEKYLIPEKIASQWIEDDDLMLILDALDEVASEQQHDCVNTINVYRQDHLVRVAVGSRIADYEALTVRLISNGAIFIKPLTFQKVNHYFENIGVESSVIREILGGDETINELAQTPLMLNIIAKAYQEIQTVDFKILTGTKARRSYLFDIYINRVAKRNRKDAQYSLDEIKRWLAWLAKNLSLHNQNVYRIESLQPSWLPISVSLIYYFLITRLVAVIILALSISLFTSSLVTTPSLTSVGILLLLPVLMKTSLLPNLENEIPSTQLYRWDWARSKKGLAIGISFGLVLFIFSYLLPLSFNSTVGGIKSCFYVVHSRICFRVGILSVASINLVFVSSLIIAGAIIGGLNGKTIVGNTGANQSLSLTFRNAINIGLLIGLIASLFMGFFVFSPKEIDANTQLIAGEILKRMWTAGLGISLLAFLLFGGFTIIRHYVLRIILAWVKVTPWNYIPFLDYCVDRIFLRRVGGGYIFVHRLLMEHFADMYPTDEK